MSRDYTREILLKKYGYSIPATQEAAAPTQEPQPQGIYKAAGELPAIAKYESIGDWLKAVVAATRGWPEDLRSSVVADEMKKHLLR